MLWLLAPDSALPSRVSCMQQIDCGSMYFLQYVLLQAVWPFEADSFQQICYMSVYGGLLQPCADSSALQMPSLAMIKALLA